MDKAIVQKVPLLAFSFFILLSVFFSSSVRAEAPISQAPGTQLAYYYGYKGFAFYAYRPNYVYFGQGRKASNYAWTSWNYIGYGCRRSCLINQWNGYVVRCVKRCF